MKAPDCCHAARPARLSDASLLTAAQRRDFEAFEAGDWPHPGFHHRQHVRMGWIYLRLFSPLEEALQRFSCALKRFARLRGKPDLYHQTITWAYLLMINERLHQQPDLSWEEFEARNPDLMRWKGGILEELYDRQRLFSDLAKQTFLLPQGRNQESAVRNQEEGDLEKGKQIPKSNPTPIHEV